ncbi:MAG: hypothetical protein PQJ59_17395 [Spirochaetales bacterium]|nr:hypothetical protein [Spirochaetales bacterium]
MTDWGSIRSLTIFHYHLLPGGVTDVIVLSVRAILTYMEGIKGITIVSGRADNMDKVREKILADMPPSATEKLSLEVLPSIDYREKMKTPLSPEALKTLLEERFAGEDNLWMVHNYQLGKNPAFTQALLLAGENTKRPLLFYIHDFPECSRYANLAALKEGTDRSIYPQRTNIAYCVINDRDRQYLISAGIEEENIWLLNNPVPLGKTALTDGNEVKSALYKRYSGQFPAMKEKGKLFFYPVRSIRRKNVFEAAFLVKMLEEEVNFVVSLPGVSPAEKPYSDLVEKAFKEGLIPGLWGIGADEETPILNYRNFWAASDLIISPSIQEGFGYLYLNALHWRKPLYTRYLDIMEGFKSLFKPDSSHFYEQVPLPLTKEERRELSRQYTGKIENLSGHMPMGLKETLMDKLEGLLQEDQFCFSYLTPEQQYNVLRKLDNDRAFRDEAIALNKENLSALAKVSLSRVPDRDREIGASFGSENYTDTLGSIISALERGCREIKEERNIQEGLEERFFSLPYLRLLYGEGK